MNKRTLNALDTKTIPKIRQCMYQNTLTIRTIGSDPALETIAATDTFNLVEGLDLDIAQTTWDEALANLNSIEPDEVAKQLPTLILAKVEGERELNSLRFLLTSLSKLKDILVHDERPYDQEEPSPLHDTDVVALLSDELFAELGRDTQTLTDAWITPMPKNEAQFRFQKWLERFKQRADAWQTSQFLEATISSTPSLVWFKTANGIHEKVNNSFCEVVGKEKDDVQGKGHAYIWDVEEDDQACIDSENKTMASRTTSVSEEIVHAGDEELHLTTYKSPLYDLNGDVMGTVGVALDVTQEQMYKQDLLRKNKDLESVFTAMECGVLIHSLAGSRVLEINQAALDILGYETVSAMIAAGFNMFATSVLKEDADRIRTKLESLKSVGNSVNIKYRVHHDDGSIIHVIGNIKLIERNGELLYQQFLLDDSERQRSEDEREEQQRALVEALSENYTAVFVMDAETGEGYILRLARGLKNDIERKFFETSSLSDALSGYIERMVSEDDKPILRESILRDGILEQLQDQDRYHVLYRVNTNYLGAANASTEDTPSPEDSDDMLEYRQVTVAKAGNWNTGSKTVVIGFRNVDEATREELHQKTMLETALDEAERANRAKSTFLTNMSHDIRTPMNAIIGFTTLASDHLGDADVMEDYLNKINASSTHLLSLINDILDMSRIESGNTKLDKRPCCMKDILENLISIMKPEAESHGLSLSLHTDGDMDTAILADKLKVEQIMLNLLGNSVKFTPEGGAIGATCTRIEGAPEGQARYRLTVEDNGIGMEQEFLEHIFDPFERENTSTVSKIEGTGLGMSITRNLVNMMDGSISVESEKGEGTRFIVELDFELANEEEAKLVGHPIPPRASDFKKLKGHRVLLVDDNMINREIAQAILQNAGLKVDCAVDGQDAVDKLAEAPADRYKVVLMDIQMPGMNGYETTEVIRKMDDPKKAQIPILAVTADAFEEDRKRALDVGMNGHVAKPIKIPELFDALDQLLG